MKTHIGFLSAVLILIIITACIMPASASTTAFWTNSGYLNSGKSATYQIQVDCGAQLVLQSPHAGEFNLYVMRNPLDRSLSESQIKSQSELTELSFTQSKYLNLNQGSWYVVVYAHSGYGQYQLNAYNTCNTPIYPTVTPTTDPCYGNPNCGNTNCAPSASDVKTSTLSTGEANTYTYQITNDRNYIEWVLSGSCGNDVIPMAMMSTNEVSTLRTNNCGPNFSLYIYKDCDPRSGTCSAIKADTSSGSSKYVGITYPTTGSKYYALVYAKSGSGRYTLNARSYNCKNDVIAMMDKEPEIVAMMSTETNVAPINVLGTN
jgi:hypothetical protein